jgi:hypothetical protein
LNDPNDDEAPSKHLERGDVTDNLMFTDQTFESNSHDDDSAPESYPALGHDCNSEGGRSQHSKDTEPDLAGDENSDDEGQDNET